MTADAESDASTLPQPHGPRHAAHEPEQPPSGRRFGLTGGQWLAVARFLVAVGVSAVLCVLLDRFAAPSLPARTDIVGYPMFVNYNSERYLFFRYRLTVYAFPLLAIVGYVLLARFGPLRARGPRPAKRAIELVEPVLTARPTPERASWGPVARVLLPAAVVVAAGGSRTGHPDLIAVAAGVVYTALVAAIAGVWARRTDGQRWRALSAVNGVGGAIAAVLSLWFVSAHTVVQTTTGTRSWPWLAWWLPVLGVVAIGWWSARQLRGGRAAPDVELTLLTVVVGAIALFLAMSMLPGPIMRFVGFDDSLDATGASLLARGYFPWRDFLFVHGLFTDVLTGSLGRAIFEDSIWGVLAVHTVILVPLFVVCIYLFAVWFSRRNPWFLALFLLVVIGLGTGQLLEWQRFMGLHVSGLLLKWERTMSYPYAFYFTAERFVAWPATLIVFGEMLRRRSARWAVGLTLLLVVDEILVPETLFGAAPVLACVVAAELLHRRPGQSLWTNLRLTRWCVGTGLVATAAWAAFLAAFGSLRAFIDYYLALGPGHNLVGAWPPELVYGFFDWTLFALDIGCVLITVWAVTIKVAKRADWETRDWVTVAAAGFTVLYVEKVIADFHTSHLFQVFVAALPLVLVWSWRLFNWLVLLLAAWWRGRGARPAWLAHSLDAVLVPAIALILVCAGPINVVDKRHHLVGATESGVARVGYAVPGVIDTSLLRDLDTAIRAYAGDNGPVFDMTQSLGYLYYLLNRVPGTQFIYPVLAIPAYAQGLLIDELKAVRPPVVIYDSHGIGVPGWGEYRAIMNNVRHYEVSEYVLRGWTPVLSTHGVLVMARNDLVASTPMPALSTPPQTTDLYFSRSPCQWGATPNFLPVPDNSRAITLPLSSTMLRTVVHYNGWAVDPATNLPATKVLIADGDRVVAWVKPTTNAPDAAHYLHQSKSESGFQLGAIFDAAPAHAAAYSVGADGLAHPLHGSPAGRVAALRLPDGSQVRVAPTAPGVLSGWEVHHADVNTVGELRLPNGINLRDYDLATLSATGGLGGATVKLTDQFLHEIEATWLDRAGPSLTLRVGSCPQWYGYDPSQPLYVMQSGGPPVTSVTLSSSGQSQGW